MRIQYELKFRDYFWFTAVHQFLLVAAQALYLGIAALVFMVESAQRGVLAGIVVALAAYMAAWLLQLLMNVFMLHSSKNKSLLTTHVVEVQPDALY